VDIQPSIEGGVTKAYKVLYANGIWGLLSLDGQHIGEHDNDLYIEDTVNGQLSWSRTAGGDPGSTQNSKGVNNQTPTGTATQTSTTGTPGQTVVNTQTPTTNGSLPTSIINGSWFQEEMIAGVKNLYLLVGAGILIMTMRGR
jgi:hypothetical protein